MWALVWGWITGLIVVTIAAQADVTPLAMTTDPVLTYMQAMGFPAWAGVVAWGVMRITGDIKTITTKLDAHIMQTERRLVRIEACGDRHDASIPKDFAE